MIPALTGLDAQWNVWISGGIVRVQLYQFPTVPLRPYVRI